MKKLKKLVSTPVKVGNLTYHSGSISYPRVIALGQMIFLALVLFSLPFLWEPHAKALALTWDGGGVDNNWSTCANWSSDTCPTAADALTFNGTSTKDSVVDVGFSGVVTSINITTGYTGTLSLSRSLQTTTSFTQATGTFTANSYLLDVDGAFSLSAGTFNASSGTMTFASTFTISGSPTFNANGGIVTFDGTSTATLSCSSTTFNLVTFTHTAGTKTVSSGCTLPLGSNPTGVAGTGSITLNGTLSGSGTLGVTYSFTLNSTGSLSGFTGLTVGNALTITGGTQNFSSYTTFVITSITTIQTSAVVTLPSGADFNNAFNLSTSSTLNMPSGSVFFAFTFTLNSGTTFNANGGTVVFDANLSATITCNGATFNLVSFTNTASTKTVSSGCTLPLGANPTPTSSVTLNGTLSGSGTLNVSGVLTLNSGSSLSGFSGLVTGTSLTVAGATFDASSYTNFDMNGTFVLSSGAFTAPSGTMTVASTFTISGGTFTHNSGTLTFDGNNSAVITCNNTVFNLVTLPTGSKSVSNGCTLPLGANPTINGVTLNGILSGTGYLSVVNTTLTINSNGSLSGFTGLSTGALTVTGGTQNFSSFTTFTMSSTMTIQTSANVTLPNNADLNGNLTLSTSSTLNMPSGSAYFAGSFTLNTGTIFNANGGIVVFDGANSTTITCNGATFNLVSITATLAKVVSSGCNLPLGNNPTINTGITLNGTLSGTGTLTMVGPSFFYNSTASLSGFSGLSIASLTLTSSSLDLSSYNPVTIGGNLAVSSGSTLTGPTAGMTVASGFTVSTGGTLNANGGTITLGGTSRPSTACDGTLVLSKVVLSNTSGTRTIDANCNLPLGANPTISAGGDLIVKGILSGTGKISSPSGSTVEFVVGAGLSGFNSAELGNVIVANNLDISAYFSFVVLNDLSIIKPGVLTAPAGTLEVRGDISNTSGSGFLRLNGATGERAYTSDTTPTSVTGDIDIRVKVSLDMWLYGQILVGKTNTSNLCYQFGVNSLTGFLALGSSSNGTAINYSATSTAAPSVSNFETIWVRATRSSSTGDVNFYTSTDGLSWSQLGATVSTTAGAIFDCSADLSIGANNNGSGSNAFGRFYNVQVRNNILDDGTGIVFNADFTNQTTGATNFIESSSNAATVNLGTGTATIYGPGSGTFNHNNGTVTLAGGDQQLSGDWSFYNLTKEVTFAQTLTMPAGGNISVGGLLTLKGASYNAPLSVVSSSSGSLWNIAKNGTASVLYAYIKDGNSTNGVLAVCKSVNGGNNLNFSFNPISCDPVVSSSPSSAIASSGADSSSVAGDQELSSDINDEGADIVANAASGNLESSSSGAFRWGIVAFSLFIAGGSLWWLIALIRRRKRRDDTYIYPPVLK